MREKPSQRIRSVVVLIAGIVAILAAIIIVPLAIFMAAMWAADGTWEFDGKGLRHWMFVRGSRLEQLGFVEPTPGLAHYSVALQEGTNPGWNAMRYSSTAEPQAVIDAYTARCTAMGLKILPPEPPPEGGVGLTCEIEPYINAEFWAERTAQAALTSVSVRVWGRD
jgi:hypothetical protein